MPNKYERLNLSNSETTSSKLLTAFAGGAGTVFAAVLIAWATGNLHFGSRAVQPPIVPQNINIDLDNSSSSNSEARKLPATPKVGRDVAADYEVAPPPLPGNSKMELVEARQLPTNGDIQQQFTWGNAPEDTIEMQLNDLAHRVARTGLSISGDFFLDFVASTPKQFGAFEIALEGAGDGRDLKLVFHCDNKFSDGSKYRVSTPSGEVKFQPSFGIPRHYRLKRIGKVFTLTCDSCRVLGKHEGNVVVAKFVSADHKSFLGIGLGVDKTSMISDVRFGPVLNTE